MSASTTPTDRPRAASAAARLTVTLDLPTPPLPLATAYTRVREPGWANGMTGSSAAAPPRSCACRSLALLGAHHPEVDLHAGDPGHRADRGGDVRRAACPCSGQPATVSSSSTRDHTVRRRPRRSATMPSSVIGRRISGSLTVARAAWTASSTVLAGADMAAMLRRRVLSPGTVRRLLSASIVGLVGSGLLGRRLAVAVAASSRGLAAAAGRPPCGHPRCVPVCAPACWRRWSPRPAPRPAGSAPSAGSRGWPPRRARSAAPRSPGPGTRCPPSAWSARRRSSSSASRSRSACRFCASRISGAA